MSTRIRNTAIAFLIPVAVAAVLIFYYYKNRLETMSELAKSGVVAVYDGGNVTHEDIRVFFHYPPVTESSILRAFEITPEDLSGLDKEDPERLRQEPLQLLLSFVIKHIALVEYLNARPDAVPPEEVQEQVKTFLQSLMIERMESEFEKITPAVNKEEMMQYYIRHSDEFHRDEKRLSRHLMLTLDEAQGEGASPDEVMARLLAGEDMGKLIAEESQSESEASGGVLGWNGKGVLAKEYEDALWAMEVGEITGPVAIGNTVHFIQLLDMQEKGLMPPEECFPEIEGDLVYLKRRQQVFELLRLSRQTVESDHPENTVEYRTAVLKLAYDNKLDKDEESVRVAQAFSDFARADQYFQRIVNKRKSEIKPGTDGENVWLLETRVLDELLDKMRFHFLVHLDLPDEEGMDKEDL